MKVAPDILHDNDGESIGRVGSYVQQYKDIEAGKRSTAVNPLSFSKTVRESKALPKQWNPDSEKEILLHYCKQFNCLDYPDIEDKSELIAAAINRIYKSSLTSTSISELIIKHISQEDFFNFTSPSEGVPSKIQEQEKIIKKLNINLPERSYAYKKGLEPLTEEQLDLCSFLDPKDLVFSSDEHNFFLAVLPEKKKAFDKLFKFSPKEELLYSMFKEQLGDEHKAKKLVLMSRLMQDVEPQKVVKKSKKNNSKKKISPEKINPES